jgi:hypothetical protein
MRSIYITPTQSRAIWAALIKARVIDRQGNVLYDVRVVREGHLCCLSSRITMYCRVGGHAAEPATSSWSVKQSTPPLLSLPVPVQNRGWIKLLAKILPWLKRSDPYYNLISDESQIWQGGWGSSWLACSAPPHAACMAMLASARPGRVRLPAPECLVACVAPGSRRAHASRAPAPHTCTHACPAELNLAWSWHEIVSGEPLLPGQGLALVGFGMLKHWPCPCWLSHVHCSRPAQTLCSCRPTDPVQAVLAWLETGGRANLQSLVRRYDHGQFISCLTEHREGCGRGRRMMAQE